MNRPPIYCILGSLYLRALVPPVRASMIVAVGQLTCSYILYTRGERGASGGSAFTSGYTPRVRRRLLLLIHFSYLFMSVAFFADETTARPTVLLRDTGGHGGGWAASSVRVWERRSRGGTKPAAVRRAHRERRGG